METNFENNSIQTQIFNVSQEMTFLKIEVNNTAELFGNEWNRGE